MEADLKNLRIERTEKRESRSSARTAGWIAGGGVALLCILGGLWLIGGRVLAASEVEVRRVTAVSSGGPRGSDVALNATGYIVAAHRIEVAAKVVGKVSWIGVEKGDRVTEGQVIVRLEDDEYRAQLAEASGNLASLQAKLDQLVHGSRPEEVAQALANLNVAKADQENARLTLERIRNLTAGGVMSKQNLDDTLSRYEQAAAKTNALERAHDLVRIGPRREEIDAARGQVEQARGQVDLAETNLNNTIIRAPVTGTILERNVERGEFLTTGFVGDRGAKGYVVSLADLNNLEVELDISQSDFAKLHLGQKGIVTTDAYPDRKYDGFIKEISPEANRQKATVQVKVKVEKPDSYLRPEMNSSVAFLGEERPVSAPESSPVIFVPSSAVRDNKVFVILAGRAVLRPVKPGPAGPQRVRIEQGLIGGEDLIVNPPATLKEGDKVRQKA
jgi:HlyD family secretion protein